MRCLAVLFSLLWGSALAALATTWLVNPDGSGNFPTIQAAINAATAGDTVALGNGAFRGNGNRDVSFLGKAITVRSLAGIADSCIIDCEGTIQQPHRGFIFQSGETAASVLRSVTIRNGYAYGTSTAGRGGGVYCAEDPTIQDCVFENNRASLQGGAVRWGNAAPTISGCVFSGNSAEQGGALYCGGTSAEGSVTGCSFSANAATSGGAMYFGNYAHPIVTGCRVYGNSASASGGGVYCGDASPEFHNTTLVLNASPVGAGVCSYGSSAPMFWNTIVAFNEDGEGFTKSGSGGPYLACCDMYGNAGGDWVGWIAGQLGERGNICEDPVFCDSGAEDFELHEGSPCAPFTPPNDDCDLIGAEAVGCGPIYGACCLGDSCALTTPVDCFATGGDWLSGVTSCDPDPCEIYACCVGENCQLLREVECSLAGGEWLPGIDSCDSAPCSPAACCVGGECQLLALADCQAAGGAWFTGRACDPDPCSPAACCRDGLCQLLTLGECLGVGGEWFGSVDCQPNPCGADTFLIRPDGLGDFANIQTALDVVPAGSVILLAEGVFTGEGNRDLVWEGRSLTLRSVGDDPEACVLDCQGGPGDPHVGISIDNVDAPSLLQGVTITNGYADGGAAGIACSNASLSLANCIVSHHAGDGGTGIRIDDASGPIDVSHCRIEGNQSGAGGGVYCVGGAEALTFTDCTFAGNVSQTAAGAVYCAGCSLVTFTHCVFMDNGANLSAGGALYCPGSNLVVDLCIFDSNFAPSGSAIRLNATLAAISACTFHGNGGWEGTITLTNQGGLAPVTIDNTIITNGEVAIYCDAEGVPTLTCCDLHGNSAGDWVGAIADQFGVRGNISADPKYCDAAQDDFGLDAQSPCRPDANPSCGLIGAAPVTCDWLCDLVVTQVDVQPLYPDCGDTLVARARIENRGLDPADASAARIWINGMERCELAVPALAPGAAAWTVPCDLGAPGEGEHEVRACADADEMVAESEEGNNCLVVPVAIECYGEFLVEADGSGTHATIQAAINAASDGDVVLLADGVFTGAGNRDIDYHGKALAVRSVSGNPATCILDCQGTALDPHRGILFQTHEDTLAILRGVTVRNGYHREGGAVYIANEASPQVLDCDFVHNCSIMTDGGAVDAWGGGTLVFSGCRFEDNWCDPSGQGNGGAAFIRAAGVRFTDCRFVGNAGGMGGALTLDNNVVVEACHFEDNAGGYAGALSFQIETAEGPVLIHDCVFVDNAAQGAGAIGGDNAWGLPVTPEIRSCVFAGNRGGSAGAVEYGSWLQLASCTLVDNVATAVGGAALNIGGLAIVNTIIAGTEGGTALSAEPNAISCCDLYGNEEGDWVGPLADDYGVNGNISADPQFCNALAGDYTIDFGSPCAPPANPDCGLIGALPAACGQGVCCVGNECQVLSSAECTQIGGRFQPDWRACEPNPCSGWVEADFAAEPAAGWPPLQVQFNDLSRNGPTEWEWDLDGNGSVDATTQNPTFEYLNPGLYAVTLRVANGETADTLTRANAILVYSANNVIVQPGEILSTDPAPVAVSYIGTEPVGAVSLYFTYDDTKLTYRGIETYVPGEVFLGGVVGRWISVQWFDETGGSDPIVPGVDPDTLFAILVTSPLSEDTTRVEFERELSMLGDRNGYPIPGVCWVDQDPFGTVSVRVGALVSGHVEYYWAERAVPDAVLSMGPPNPDVNSDASGAYAFERYPLGDYTLEIDKESDRGGINALDAIKIIRHSVGVEPFGNPYKETAGDVDSNGMINALDALRTVRAAVGMDSLPSGDWAFDPPSVSFEPLDRDAEVDFVAIRMGDVNGDWLPDGRCEPRGLRPAMGGGGRDAITVALPDTTVDPGGGPVGMPVAVTEFNGVGAISLRTTFADSVLHYSQVISMVPGVSFLSHLVGNEVRIEWYDPTGGANPISIGNDTLLVMEFDPIGEAGETSTLDFTDACMIGDATGDPIEGVVFVDGSCTLHADGSAAPDAAPEIRRIYLYPVALDGDGDQIRVVFDLPVRERVRLDLYDVRGGLVRHLVSETRPAGRHVVPWRHEDQGGREVGSGVFFVRLRAGVYDQTRKLLVVR